MTRSRPIPWIGLAEIEQRPGAGVLLDENRAYTNVLGLAKTRKEFRALIERAFDAMGFNLKHLEDSEPLEQRLARATVDEEVLTLAEEVKRDNRPRFGTLYTWTSEGERRGTR